MKNQLKSRAFVCKELFKSGKILEPAPQSWARLRTIWKPLETSQPLPIMAQELPRHHSQWQDHTETCHIRFEPELVVTSTRCLCYFRLVPNCGNAFLVDAPRTLVIVRDNIRKKPPFWNSSMKLIKFRVEPRFLRNVVCIRDHDRISSPIQSDDFSSSL